jgi:hypothetical protein
MWAELPLQGLDQRSKAKVNLWLGALAPWTASNTSRGVLEALHGPAGLGRGEESNSSYRLCKAFKFGSQPLLRQWLIFLSQCPVLECALNAPRISDQFRVETHALTLQCPDAIRVCPPLVGDQREGLLKPDSCQREHSADDRFIQSHMVSMRQSKDCKPDDRSAVWSPPRCWVVACGTTARACPVSGRDDRRRGNGTACPDY